MTDAEQASANRNRPTSAAFRAFVARGWAPRPDAITPRSEVADWTIARRAALSEQFPGERLVIPAGPLKVRSNDTDYVFRPHSAFAHLTGLGADREPDAVLVLEPLAEGGHEPTLWFRPLAARDTEEFFGDSRYGEFWVGARPTIEDVESELGIRAAHIEGFADAVGKDVGEGGLRVRVLREADPKITATVDQARALSDADALTAAEESDDALAKACSVMRLVKDDWEVEQMRSAVAGTADGFDAVIADLPEAVRRGRGERWVEGVFGLHARHHGNGVGYDSICASGDHANTLHWIKNTGEIRPGDLLLLDAGVEVDSLYTADITRTLPVSGTFTPAQREIYDAVYRAQEAGFAACRPGNTFSDIHDAAIRVIAEALHGWGLLPEGVSVEDSLDRETGQYHRRWMVHGTSHHLGIDVHDCAMATRQESADTVLEAGMVVTVEPGLYFRANDLLAPERFRGNGVRIEDDVLITESGYENLSASMPRTADDVEAWIARIWATGTR